MSQQMVYRSCVNGIKVSSWGLVQLEKTLSPVMGTSQLLAPHSDARSDEHRQGGEKKSKKTAKLVYSIATSSGAGGLRRSVCDVHDVRCHDLFDL